LDEQKSVVVSAWDDSGSLEELPPQAFNDSRTDFVGVEADILVEVEEERVEASVSSGGVRIVDTNVDWTLLVC